MDGEPVNLASARERKQREREAQMVKERGGFPPLKSGEIDPHDAARPDIDTFSTLQRVTAFANNMFGPARHDLAALRRPEDDGDVYHKALTFERVMELADE
jgi:hypothetical protein